MQKHLINNTDPELFLSSGMKQTHARKEILDLLARENRPVTVSEILEHLKQQLCNTNKVTIYRTLESFVQKNIVARLEFQEGKYRYELARDDHHHLICVQCSNIQDISDYAMEAFEKQIQKEKHFSVTRHTLEFYGICINCQKEGSNNAI